MYRILPPNDRFDYTSILDREPYDWPGGRRLAVYLAINVETFAYGEGLGAALGFAAPQPDVANYAWREYGNRVGIWRMLEMLDALDLPSALLVNAALYETCPDIVPAFRARGDEIVAHAYTNSERQDDMDEAMERELIRRVTAIHREQDGRAPQGWLSPWISETAVTSDLLQEAGYRYTLNWCHDDQPTWLRTRGGRLLSVPYPQEVNDIPAIAARRMGAGEFADMIIDNYEEMLRQSVDQPLVMGIALHPYIVGQPYRLVHLRRALRHIVEDASAWLTTPGAVADHCLAIGFVR
ncbi:polysaccharide deacetylase [Acidihalobacter aeolianus]|uniref:Polysaccharide deacetylase n=1 Tax=Acidihalobacter aeolianus TaxID=2792603 RepID=A0A1D8K667_9GAMM|nr:polysaccharide deacetylase family protein [Acidihalobacter aeolianus]AOV16455.1 polysaccharide deacetylase [Acidihalobacter aeolianus]